jgi:hypothetical protein
MKGIVFIGMVFMDEITLNLDRGYSGWHKDSVHAYWRKPYAASGVSKLKINRSYWIWHKQGPVLS